MNKDINYWIARCASLEQELDIMREQNTIKWRTGEPKGEGDYLVTTNFGHVTFDKWMKKYNEGGSYYDWELIRHRIRPTYGKDKVEIVTDEDCEIVIENGKCFVVRKQSKYPNTYEECFNICFGDKYHIAQVVGLDGLGNNKELFENFIKLKICRDAYWKIAGDWQPDVMYGDLYCIGYDGNVVTWKMQGGCRLLAFPTEEMRDAFYENFKELIELVKELL